MEYHENANGKEISTKVNDQFEISLPETRTAGYQWQTADNGAPTLRLLEETTTPDPPAIGGSGHHLWRFRASSAGTAHVHLEYLRPWEKSTEPTRTFVLTVRVAS